MLLNKRQASFVIKLIALIVALAFIFSIIAWMLPYLQNP